MPNIIKAALNRPKFLLNPIVQYGSFLQSTEAYSVVVLLCKAEQFRSLSSSSLCLWWSCKPSESLLSKIERAVMGILPIFYFTIDIYITILQNKIFNLQLLDYYR